MLKIMYLFVAIAIVAGLLGLWFIPHASAPATTAVVPEGTTALCTMDALQCPDGSYVGRTGPNCQFVCPVVITTSTTTASTTVINQTDYSDEVILTKPVPNAILGTTTTITGQARGWYFEGTFPLELRDSNGLVIAQGVATAQGDWMTSSFVPFTSTITFLNPYHSGDPVVRKTGTLVLKNDNPSGLPENDKSISIPIRFAP